MAFVLVMLLAFLVAAAALSFLAVAALRGTQSFAVFIDETPTSAGETPARSHAA